MSCSTSCPNHAQCMHPHATLDRRRATALAPRSRAVVSAAGALSVAPLASPDPLVSIFLASALPVVKVAMLCGVGAWCSNQGFLNEEGRRVLSALNFNVLTPCLFFSKLAGFGISFGDPRLLPVSANIFMSHVLGGVIGWLLVRLVRSPPDLRSHLVLSTAVGNIGNLPLVLMESLASGPGAALLGASAQTGVLNVMLGNIAGTFIQFPLISVALAKPDAASARTTEASLRDRAVGVWQAVATPPLVAAVLALAVGQLPALREAIFSRTGALCLVGEVSGMLSDVCIPALMLVLGANLAKGPGVGNVPLASLVSAAFGRLVLLPLIGTACIVAAHRAGWISHLDPTALVVMLMMHAVPTALMVHSVATFNASKPDEVASILFWQYIASLATIPAFLSLFLLVAKRLST